MAASKKRAHVFVSGMVQGVSFRWYCTQVARSAGVGGWVRNTPDGRVEAVFEGLQDAVESMIDLVPRRAAIGTGQRRRGRLGGARKGSFPFDVEF